MSLPIISRDCDSISLKSEKVVSKVLVTPKSLVQLGPYSVVRRVLEFWVAIFTSSLSFLARCTKNSSKETSSFPFFNKPCSLPPLCRKKNTNRLTTPLSQVSMTGGGIFKTSRAVDGCFYEFQELAEGGLRISEVSEGRDVWWKPWWYCHLMCFDEGIFWGEANSEKEDCSIS